MIKDYEKYHGTALRALVAHSKEALTIGVDDVHGRINGYVINQRVAIYLKHSTKRLTPWNFNFNREHLDELSYLSSKHKKVFVVFICGIDGLACVPLAKLLDVGTKTADNQLSIGIARSRNQMYEVYGNERSLDRKVAVGVRAVLEELGLASDVEEKEEEAEEEPAAMVVA